MQGQERAPDPRLSTQLAALPTQLHRRVLGEEKKEEKRRGSTDDKRTNETFTGLHDDLKPAHFALQPTEERITCHPPIRHAEPPSCQPADDLILRERGASALPVHWRIVADGHNGRAVTDLESFLYKKKSANKKAWRW